MSSRLVLWLVVLGMGTSAFAAQTRLTGIRYNIRGSNSRVTLLFTNGILYSADRIPDGVKLMLRNTEVGSPPGQAHLDFTSGNVRRVEVERLGTDSAAVTILMRSAGRVEYSSSESSHALFVDVVGTSTSGSVKASAKTSNRNHAATPREKKTDEGIPVPEKPVDIAKLATPASPVPGKTQGPSTWAVILAVLFSVIIGGIGTLGTLWLYIRRTDKGHRPDVGPAVAVEETQLQVTLPRTVPPEHEERTPVRPESDTEQTPSLSLAERFQRSRGEIDFALHISSGPHRNNRGKNLANVAPAGLTLSQRAIVAKRLGIGQGEVELMATINRMKQRGTEGHND